MDTEVTSATPTMTLAELAAHRSITPGESTRHAINANDHSAQPGVTLLTFLLAGACE